MDQDRYVLNSTKRLFHFKYPPRSSNGSTLATAKKESFGLNLVEGLYKTPLYVQKPGEAEPTAQEKYRQMRSDEIEFKPLQVLDCPDLRDDFYLNILDWSKQDMISIALDTAVYTYDYQTQKSECITSCSNQSQQYISALTFLKSGNYLAIATSLGCIDVFDVITKKPIGCYSVPKKIRVATLATKDNEGSFSDHILFAGSKKGLIYGFDTRKKNSALVFKGHELEICGLSVAENSWSFASGGNDNKVMIWDLRREKPLYRLENFDAAIKALCWCPWQQSLLATGAGIGDKKIRFWNTSTGLCLRSVETSSQVSGLVWSPLLAEIISSHGYTTNDLKIWRYPELDTIMSISAHDTRILQIAMSPDGTMVATTAANDSLKFWKLYNKRPSLRNPPKRSMFDHLTDIYC